MPHRAASSIRDSVRLDPGRAARGRPSGKSAGWKTRACIAAAAGVLLMLRMSQVASGQELQFPTVKSIAELCVPDYVVSEAGPAAPGWVIRQPGGVALHPSQIHGMIVEYQWVGTRMAVGLYSLDQRHMDLIAKELPRFLDWLYIPRQNFVQLRRCPPFFSRSAGYSYLHENLFDVEADRILLRIHRGSAFVVAAPIPPGPPPERRPDLQAKPRIPDNREPKVARPSPAWSEPAGPKTVRRKPDDKPKIATLSPPPERRGTSEPPVEKPLKLYPKPDYHRVSRFPGLEEDMGATGRTVFAVEKVECSDQGNWMTGYFGIVHQLENRRKLVIKQRYGVNNYPGEGIIGLAELKSKKKNELSCAAGDSTCSAPRETQTYERFLKSDPRSAQSSAVVSIAPIELTTRGAVADKSSPWSCRPDKNLCASRATDHWQCDPQSQTCASFDPTRWWCVPRREFCFSRVRFRDWGSRYDENDEIALKPDDLVYDMADGFLPIVKDALTRRCGGSEPAGNWSETWSKWSDKGPNANSSR
jgi:hypothetical protein